MFDQVLNRTQAQASFQPEIQNTKEKRITSTPTTRFQKQRGRSEKLSFFDICCKFHMPQQILLRFFVCSNLKRNSAIKFSFLWKTSRHFQHYRCIDPALQETNRCGPVNFFISFVNVSLSSNTKNIRELSWMSHRVIRLAFFDTLALLSISRVFSSNFSGRRKSSWLDIPRTIVKCNYIN